MSFIFDLELRQKLHSAKLGKPEEDAFEVIVTSRPFPPDFFPEIEGIVVEPDVKFPVSLLDYLRKRGIATFESTAQDYCDQNSGKRILIGCAAQIERIAEIPEVIKIELRRQGPQLIDEFNEGKRRLLNGIKKDQSCSAETSVPGLYQLLADALSQHTYSFRPQPPANEPAPG